jgi:hypothetical protein
MKQWLFYLKIFEKVKSFPLWGNKEGGFFLGYKVYSNSLKEKN